MGVMGQLSHRDPPFPPWSRKKESQGAIVGERPSSPNLCICWAKCLIQGLEVA